MNKVVVLDLSETALLVSWKTGVTYRNQVGGTRLLSGGDGRNSGAFGLQ